MGVLQGLAHNGSLYAAWKGEPDDDRIFYSIWSGSGNWSTPAGLIDGNTSAGPALAMFNGTPYAAWKGEWSDPRIFFAKYNGSSWEQQEQIPNVYSDSGPALWPIRQQPGGRLEKCLRSESLFRHLRWAQMVWPNPDPWSCEQRGTVPGNLWWKAICRLEGNGVG